MKPGLLLVFTLLALPCAGAAQTGDDVSLEGRLHLAGAPADSGTVVLHRVTPEESGAIDSVRVGPDGTFRLALPDTPVPGSGEIFFASYRHEGILYFGVPLTDPVQLDSAYVIEAYRTRTAPTHGEGLPFTVSVRNLFIDQGPMGWRVTDLVEIHNDSAVTWVPGPDDRPVWRYPLPPQALSPRVGQSELAEGAVRFSGGAMHVHAPVPPGERLYVAQYEVADIEFTLPLPGRTEILEVLVEEPAPALTMEGLVASPPAELEPGRTYQRWTGIELDGAAIRVRRREEGGTELLPWIGVGLALILLGAGVWAVGRGRARPPSAVPAGGGARGRILLELAELDEAFESLDDPGSDAVARYRTRRRALLDRLARLEAGTAS